MAKSSPDADSFESLLRGNGEDAPGSGSGGGASGSAAGAGGRGGRPSRRERKADRARAEAARAEVERAEAARGGRGSADTAATERFGWGAASFGQASAGEFNRADPGYAEDARGAGGQASGVLYESGSRVGSPYAAPGGGLYAAGQYAAPHAGQRSAGQPGGYPGQADYDDPMGYTSAVEPVRPAAPEKILVRARPHARRLLVPVLVLFATTTAFGWFGGHFPEEWQNWTAVGVAGGLVFFAVLLPFLAWLGHRYTITTRRVIARRGLLVRHRQDVYLARVTDVRLRRTPLQAAFASGDVRVVAGPDLVLVLHDVPSARLVADLLGDLTEHPTPPSHLPYP
jgi:membrane protein YdbS with pleckstrin-like domain